MALFSLRKPRTRTPPNREPAHVGVNVMAPKGHRVVMPNTGRDVPTMGMNLKAVRAAAVLDRYCDYLQGNGPTPDLGELVDACRFAADHMRDGVVIGDAH